MTYDSPPPPRPWTLRFAAAWNGFWFTPGDPIVLGALRVATGLLATYLLITWTGDLVPFFGRDGLLPSGAVASWAEPYGSRRFPSVGVFSYLSYVGDPAALRALHAGAIAVLAAFTLGIVTRAMSILSLVIFLSYMHRAPMLVSQVEPVVAMVLFYLCLAPCGACLSVDAWWRRGAAPSLAANVATRLLQIHTAGLVAMIALAQLAGGAASPWWDGQAVWALISRPEMPLLDLTVLAGYPFLLDFWTRFIVVVELAFPILVWQRALRPWVLVIAAAMWASLAILTGLTPFCLMMIVASLSFVSPASIRKRLPREAAAPDESTAPPELTISRQPLAASYEMNQGRPGTHGEAEKASRKQGKSRRRARTH